MKKVTIYTTPACTYCQQVKDFFKARNVTYSEFNVLTEVAKRQEMVDKSGQMGVPVITVSEANGSKEEVIIGFNRPHLAELLGVK